MELRGSANASVASPNADFGKGRENESEGLPPEMLNTLEDLTGAELQFNTDSGDLKNEKEPNTSGSV